MGKTTKLPNLFERIYETFCKECYKQFCTVVRTVMIISENAKHYPLLAAIGVDAAEIWPSEFYRPYLPTPPGKCPARRNINHSLKEMFPSPSASISTHFHREDGGTKLCIIFVAVVCSAALRTPSLFLSSSVKRSEHTSRAASERGIL